MVILFFLVAELNSITRAGWKSTDTSVRLKCLHIVICTVVSTIWKTRGQDTPPSI